MKRNLPRTTRIIHVIDSMDPSTGGPPMVVARLAAAQAAQGHDAAIFSRAPLDGMSHPALDGIPGLDRVQRFSYSPNGIVDRLTARSAQRRLQAIATGSDILHLHGVWCRTLAAAARVARRTGARYVVTPHGVLNPWSIRQKRWKKRLAWAFGARVMLERAHFVHVLNADEARSLERLALHSRIAIIPNGVFPEEFAHLPPRHEFATTLPQLAGRPYVLFLGRLHEKKGLDLLADAFRILARDNPDVDLVVAGPDDGARREFERRIAHDDLAQRVHLTGPIYGRAKYAALRGAACFCLPSRDEGFSMAIVEALACGVPVVVSGQCNFPEVATHGAGTVVRLDPAHIAAALERFIADRTLQRHAGRAARALVLSRYTWPAIARALLKQYVRQRSGARRAGS